MKIFFVTLLTVFLFLSCDSRSYSNLGADKTKNSSIPASNPNPDLSQPSGLIKTQHGEMRFRLFPKRAPETTRRFVELVNQGFYNGLSFHHVVPGFIVQTGDPRGDGTGGSGKPIPAEFNHTAHARGILSMARGKDPDSADSQFFIVLGQYPHLNDHYTAFGKIEEGLQVLDKIKKGDRIEYIIFVN